MRQSPVKCSVEIQNEILCQDRGSSKKGANTKKDLKVATEAASANKTFGCFYKCLFSTKRAARKTSDFGEKGRVTKDEGQLPERWIKSNNNNREFAFCCCAVFVLNKDKKQQKQQEQEREHSRWVFLSAVLFLFSFFFCRVLFVPSTIILLLRRIFLFVYQRFICWQV